MQNPTTPARWAGAFAATAVAFGVLDALWLGVVAKDSYSRLLGDLMADPINAPAAALFYAIYVAGITHFATAPGAAARSTRTAGIQGALLGLVAYSTFGLTNLAVIEGFPATMVPVDLAWGTLATGSAAAIATAVVNRSTRERR